MNVGEFAEQVKAMSPNPVQYGGYEWTYIGECAAEGDGTYSAQVGRWS